MCASEVCPSLVGTPQTSVPEHREGWKKGDPGPLIGAPRTITQRGAEPPQDDQSPENAAAFRLRRAAGSLAQVPKVSPRSTLTTHVTGVGSLSLVPASHPWPVWVFVASLHGSEGP